MCLKIAHLLYVLLFIVIVSAHDDGHKKEVHPKTSKRLAKYKTLVKHETTTNSNDYTVTVDYNEVKHDDNLPNADETETTLNKDDDVEENSDIADIENREVNSDSNASDDYIVYKEPNAEDEVTIFAPSRRMMKDDDIIDESDEDQNLVDVVGRSGYTPPEENGSKMYIPEEYFDLINPIQTLKKKNGNLDNFKNLNIRTYRTGLIPQLYNDRLRPQVIYNEQPKPISIYSLLNKNRNDDDEVLNTNPLSLWKSRIAPNVEDRLDNNVLRDTVYDQSRVCSLCKSNQSPPEPFQTGNGRVFEVEPVGFNTYPYFNNENIIPFVSNARFQDGTVEVGRLDNIPVVNAEYLKPSQNLDGLSRSLDSRGFGYRLQRNIPLVLNRYHVFTG